MNEFKSMHREKKHSTGTLDMRCNQENMRDEKSKKQESYFTTHVHN